MCLDNDEDEEELDVFCCCSLLARDAVGTLPEVTSLVGLSMETTGGTLGLLGLELSGGRFWLGGGDGEREEERDDDLVERRRRLSPPPVVAPPPPLPPPLLLLLLLLLFSYALSCLSFLMVTMVFLEDEDPPSSATLEFDDVPGSFLTLT